jgi:hypothetical protein
MEHPARRLEPLPRAPLFVYTLTRIYSVEYIKRMESVFEIIAEPNRRAIDALERHLDRMAQSTPTKRKTTTRPKPRT